MGFEGIFGGFLEGREELTIGERSLGGWIGERERLEVFGGGIFLGRMRSGI